MWQYMILKEHLKNVRGRGGGKPLQPKLFRNSYFMVKVSEISEYLGKNISDIGLPQRFRSRANSALGASYLLIASGVRNWNSA